jgi:hypothetical protein
MKHPSNLDERPIATVTTFKLRVNLRCDTASMPASQIFNTDRFVLPTELTPRHAANSYSLQHDGKKCAIPSPYCRADKNKQMRIFIFDCQQSNTSVSENFNSDFSRINYSEPDNRCPIQE